MEQNAKFSEVTMKGLKNAEKMKKPERAVRGDNQGAVEGPASGGNLDDNAEENVGDRDSSAISEDLDPAVSRANEVGKKAPTGK